MTGEKFYYLMHKDKEAAILTMDELSGNILKVAGRVNAELLPIGGRLSPGDLVKWWERRAVPKSQGNIKVLLSGKKIPTTTNYLFYNLGLSLFDHYWIKPADSVYEWKDVNLFTNDFVDEIGELQVRTRAEVKTDSQTSFYPSASLQGDLKKKWIVKKGKRYLVKGNRGDSFQQSINEVIATNLHKKQAKMPYTNYRLCNIEVDSGIEIGCICKNFADENIEFIPAYDVVASVKKRNDISEYEQFIQVCVCNGMSEEMVREFLEYQILTDFVLTNVDRHFNNFGVLRDSQTLKFIGMAPIFDSGNSLFWNNPALPLNDDLLNVQITSFRSKEIDLLKYVKNAHLVNLDKLPSEDEIRSLLIKDKYWEKKIDAIIFGYFKKISYLEQLQRGEKIFNYNKKTKETSEK